MAMAHHIDATQFRRVLGHFPTGVAVVTSADSSGAPIGLTVGTFTSVSLDPPMVAFLPGRLSRTFEMIRATGRFCVNVLAADQELTCRTFAAPNVDRFADVNWRLSPGGAPILEDSVAWIECTLGQVHEAGDHLIVLGDVQALEVNRSSMPLLFFQGGYGRFWPASLVAPAEPDLAGTLRYVDVARPTMERLASDLRAECAAIVNVSEQLIVVAGANRPGSRTAQTRVGSRLPHIPPLGALFVAWSRPTAVEAWINRLPHPPTEADRDRLRAMVARVRERGWSIGTASESHSKLEQVLGEVLSGGSGEGRDSEIIRAIDQLAREYEPDLGGTATWAVRNISAPVFDSGGCVLFALYLLTPHLDDAVDCLDRFVDELMRAASEITDAIADLQPSASSKAGAGV